MALSDRLRPDVECPKWLIDEVRRLEDALREFVRLCEIGDIDETTEAHGWGEVYARAKLMTCKAPLRGVSLPALARDALMRELDVACPIVPKGQELWDVYHLSNDKKEWIRYAYCMRINQARNLAREPSGAIGATWIRPHDRSLGSGVIPV